MPRGQTSIQAFGRISKPRNEAIESKKRKATPDVATFPASGIPIANRKKRCIKPQQTSIDSPMRAIGRTLAGLELARLSPTPEPTRTARRTASSVSFEDTPPTSPCPSTDTEALQTNLPVELEDFVALNKAVLAGIAFHHAHYGTASPLDLKQLAPAVTSIWGKRRVEEADIMRCLGVLERSGESALELFDYGNGRTCIELREERSSRRAGVRFDQDRLNTLFEQHLRQMWARHCDIEDSAEPMAFTSSLAAATVKLSPTASKTAQSIGLKRGRKRLEEVLGPRDDSEGNNFSKRRRMQTQEASFTGSLLPTLAAATVKPKENAVPAAAPATSRAESLLDRIRAKQMHAASLPAAPTKDQMNRVAALQRVEEVMSILNLLVAAKGQGPKASFSLPSLVQSIQGSLRSQMAREEVERCLTIMEKEVALGYVKCLKMGSMSGVVVDTLYKPKKEVLMASLKAAGV